jgi:hypothetical protein
MEKMFLVYEWWNCIYEGIYKCNTHAVYYEAISILRYP